MAIIWLKSGVISRENINSNAAFPCMQSADPGPGLAHRTSRCLMKENLRLLLGFASHPIPCTSVPIRMLGNRQEIESNVRGVLGVTKITASPISSFVTFLWLYTQLESELRKERVVGLTGTLAALLPVCEADIQFPEWSHFLSRRFAQTQD